MASKHQPFLLVVGRAGTTDAFAVVLAIRVSDAFFAWLE